MSVEGPGVLAGFGSAAPATEESYLDDVAHDVRRPGARRRPPDRRRDHHRHGDGGGLPTPVSVTVEAR